jgi:hypothetical protein
MVVSIVSAVFALLILIVIVLWKAGARALR